MSALYTDLWNKRKKNKKKNKEGSICLKEKLFFTPHKRLFINDSSHILPSVPIHPSRVPFTRKKSRLHYHTCNDDFLGLMQRAKVNMHAAFAPLCSPLRRIFSGWFALDWRSRAIWFSLKKSVFPFHIYLGNQSKHNSAELPFLFKVKTIWKKVLLSTSIMDTACPTCTIIL